MTHPQSGIERAGNGRLVSQRRHETSHGTNITAEEFPDDARLGVAERFSRRRHRAVTVAPTIWKFTGAGHEASAIITARLINQTVVPSRDYAGFEATVIRGESGATPDNLVPTSTLFLMYSANRDDADPAAVQFIRDANELLKLQGHSIQLPELSQ